MQVEKKQNYYLFAHHCKNKYKIVHLVSVRIHEQEISASSAELFRGDPQLYLSIKLLTDYLALHITIQIQSNFNEMMQAYQFLEFLL